MIVFGITGTWTSTSEKVPSYQQYFPTVAVQRLLFFSVDIIRVTQQIRRN